MLKKGVYARMARGEKVRFMAGIQAEESEQLRTFNWSGNHFNESMSSETEYVFVRTEISGRQID